MGYRFSVFLGDVGSCFDRYCRAYGKPFKIEELFSRVASVEGITGVDLVVDDEFIKKERQMKELAASNGLEVVSLNPDLFSSPLWRQGTLSSRDGSVRRKALDLIFRTADLALEWGCGLVALWPGQDGYDYLFQADYLAERELFASGVREICKKYPGITIGLEYKPKEPRMRSYLSSAAMAILVIQEVGEPNCRAVLDYGHALYGGENPAESVALFHRYGKTLGHIHINDNYRSWDDDMIVGSVHTLEFLEFFHWLRKTGYAGWITIDQFSYREDGRDAVAESVAWMRAMEAALERIDARTIDEVLAGKDAVESSRLMRRLLFE